MGSINNWLSGYSLSPQHHHHSQNSVSLNNLHPDDIFQAFNKNPQSSDDDQDWNMKEMSMNSFTCNNKNPNDYQSQETPKLENFLGVEGHSFTQDHNNQAADNYNGDNNIYNVYEGANNNNGSNNSSSSMGLSMIKNWLRNNQQPPHAAADNQNLSLCMSTGGSSDNCKLLQSGATEIEANDQVPKKSVDNTFGQRTSIYRGVTRHRWTGRYEAHLWDNSHRREGQTRKGRQVYLGGYDKEEKAARAYDLAALKYWGTTTTTNFPISNYETEIEEMKHMTRQEYVASLRRKSSGFSRGASIYRGVTRHHQHGRWQARIGRVAGNKDLYLGTFSTQEEAAEAYDIAAIKFRGLNAVTNFEINRYDVKSILESATLPIGGAAKRLKDAENAEMALQMHLLQADERNLINLQLTDDRRVNGYGDLNNSTHLWPINQPLSMYQRFWCKQEQDSQVNHGFNDLNNLMSLDSNNPAVYGENAVQMMGTVIVNDQNQTNGFAGSDEGMFGSADYHARNLYYQSDQQSSSSNGMAKVGVYDHDQGSVNCNNWISSGGVPNLAYTANATAVCHGGSTFTVWNDT